VGFVDGEQTDPGFAQPDKKAFVRKSLRRHVEELQVPRFDPGVNRARRFQAEGRIEPFPPKSTAPGALPPDPASRRSTGRQPA